MPASMPTLTANIASRPLSMEQSMREAVLLTFCDPPPELCSRLQSLSEKEWWKLLNWLDISGLALYFLDRIIQLELCDWLPADVFARLRQSLPLGLGQR